MLSSSEGIRQHRSVHARSGIKDALTVIERLGAFFHVEGRLGISGFGREVTLAKIDQVDRVELLDAELLRQLVCEVVLDVLQGVKTFADRFSGGRSGCAGDTSYGRASLAGHISDTVTNVIYDTSEVDALLWGGVEAVQESWRCRGLWQRDGAPGLQVGNKVLAQC